MREDKLWWVHNHSLFTIIFLPLTFYFLGHWLELGENISRFASFASPLGLAQLDTHLLIWWALTKNFNEIIPKGVTGTSTDIAHILHGTLCTTQSQQEQQENFVLEHIGRHICHFHNSAFHSKSNNKTGHSTIPLHDLIWWPQVPRAAAKNMSTNQELDAFCQRNSLTIKELTLHSHTRMWVQLWTLSKLVLCLLTLCSRMSVRKKYLLPVSCKMNFFRLKW